MLQMQVTDWAFILARQHDLNWPTPKTGKVELARLQSIAQKVFHEIRTPVSEGQFQAVVSWAADADEGLVQGPDISWEGSKLIKLLNVKQYQIAGAEFANWCIVNGRINLQALKKRRIEEQLYYHGVLP